MDQVEMVERGTPPHGVDESAAGVDADSPAAGGAGGNDGDLSSRVVGWFLTVFGLIGLLASATLMIEKVELLIDPTFVPSCNINPILSCGSVMVTPQASVFGFPNPVIGVATFPVVAATGLAVLAGARMRGWYWWGLLAGTLGGVVFIHWLAFQSIFVIGALCPYCMVAWVCTMATLCTTLSQLARNARLPRFFRHYSILIFVGWVAAMTMVIAWHFAAQWAALI
ncbi:MAG: vitamin K epoxide reductase family protein [Actinomycetales bacterium]